MAELSRRRFLGNSAFAASAMAAKPDATVAPQSDREYWVSVLRRISEPVLTALANGRLKLSMPVEAPHGNIEERRRYTYLEAFGRLLCGVAPWLECSDLVAAERELQSRYADLARKCIRAAVDPASPDFMNFDSGQQPLVDSAFLALAVLRAPSELWQKLDTATRAHLVRALVSSRAITPGFNNWLLFSAMVEAFLSFAGESWDTMRVDYAIRQHDEWYKGDGTYGDGPLFHWDYYNSFVIHPLLLQVLATVSQRSQQWKSFATESLNRAQRYAAIQERLIGPDGSYPAVGRSITYRFGAFHLLAAVTLSNQLPDSIRPAQVRCALTAVIKRMIEAPGTFDDRGWLQVGFVGHQPTLAESYISTGSLYLCSAALLPLGLPPSDSFWSAPPAEWTAKRIWNGQDVSADHAI